MNKQLSEMNIEELQSIVGGFSESDAVKINFHNLNGATFDRTCISVPQGTKITISSDLALGNNKVTINVGNEVVHCTFAGLSGTEIMKKKFGYFYMTSFKVETGKMVSFNYAVLDSNSEPQDVGTFGRIFVE